LAGYDAAELRDAEDQGDGEGGEDEPDKDGFPIHVYFVPAAVAAAALPSAPTFTDALQLPESAGGA